MASARVFACLMLLVAGGLTRISYAETFSSFAFAQAVEVGEGISELAVESNASDSLAGTSAMVSAAHGGTVATASTRVTPNLLFGIVEVQATRLDFNSLVGGLTEALWCDVLGFDELGDSVNSGSVLLVAELHGQILLFGEGAGARATLNLAAGPAENEARAQVSVTENGIYNTNISLVYTGDLSQGLNVSLQLLLGAGNNSFSPSISQADFASTARITKVVYLTPEGQPDPSVNVTSASGTVYGVPEPSSGALALVGLVGAGGLFRRRSSRRALARAESARRPLK